MSYAKAALAVTVAIVSGGVSVAGAGAQTTAGTSPPTSSAPRESSGQTVTTTQTVAPQTGTGGRQTTTTPTTGPSTTPTTPSPSASGQAPSSPSNHGPATRQRSPDRLAGAVTSGTATQPAAAATTTTTTLPASPAALPQPAGSSLLPAFAGALGPPVPNFFLNTYRVPPFLLGIYQAAGMEYGVPWEVLAAINEIETDYGADLSVSSAGAVGWMQFLPQTWQAYGVDATADGKRDPYNPVDAIFAAARYLNAAGAQHNLGDAIFSYNHAAWYVQSVLLRAKLIAGLPDALVNSLTDLSDGHFPVAAASRVTKATSRKSPAAWISAASGARVIAVRDSTVTRLGQSAALGRYVTLRDDGGNAYTYTHLGSVADRYPWPKQQTSPGGDEPTLPAPGGAPTLPATAGGHAAGGLPASTAGTASTAAARPRERLFANPRRHGAYAAGGRLQLEAAAQARAEPLAAGQSLAGYLTDSLSLRSDEVVLRPLRVSSRVLAGTVLGRTGAVGPLGFAIHPAGVGSPNVDPAPFLASWQLLGATGVFASPADGSLGRHLSVSQIFLVGRDQLAEAVLGDSRVRLAGCERRAIVAGAVDRDVLATLEFLAAGGLHPTVSALACQPARSPAAVAGSAAAAATVPAHAIDDTLDLSSVNSIPIQGHQGTGTITDTTIRRLLQLQAAMRPDQIISLMKFPGAANAVAHGNHHGDIEIDFQPAAPAPSARPLAPLATAASYTPVLAPNQWKLLLGRLEQLVEPPVLDHPSSAAIDDGPGSVG